MLLRITNQKLNTEIAYGYTKFDASIDSNFEDMFNRADALMYQSKRELKEKNNKFSI